MDKVTFGKYIPGNSIMHKLDPRIKIALNILVIVLAFLVKDFIMLGIIIALPLSFFLFSSFPKKAIIPIIKTVIFISLFLFVINIFIIKYDVTKQSTLTDKWFDKDIRWKGFWISYKAVNLTALIAARIFIMILTTTLMTSTTRPTGLSKGIEDLLLPLKLIKIPVHIIAMIISIALRFIPTLIEETQRIMKAQSSRGVDFKNGGIKSKVKASITLIIPLFVSAFSKAEELGNAMETRGYDPYEKRTKYRKYSIKYYDIMLALSFIGLLVTIILMKNGVIITPTWWI